MKRTLTCAPSLWARSWRLRARSLRGYAAHVRLYLVPYLGQIPLAGLPATHVQAMFTAITRQHAAAGTPVAPAALARVKATLRAALNAAIGAGRITASPASRAELPPARRPRAVVWTSARAGRWQQTGIRPAVAVWTPAQTAAFLNAIGGHRLYAAYHMIAVRGLRRGEACGCLNCVPNWHFWTARVCCLPQPGRYRVPPGTGIDSRLP